MAARLRSLSFLSPLPGNLAPTPRNTELSPWGGFCGILAGPAEIDRIPLHLRAENEQVAWGRVSLKRLCCRYPRGQSICPAGPRRISSLSFRPRFVRMQISPQKFHSPRQISIFSAACCVLISFFSPVLQVFVLLFGLFFPPLFCRHVLRFESLVSEVYHTNRLGTTRGRLPPRYGCNKPSLWDYCRGNKKRGREVLFCFFAYVGLHTSEESP